MINLIMQAYPEYARQVLDKAEPEFNSAIYQWAQKYNQVKHDVLAVLTSQH